MKESPLIAYSCYVLLFFNPILKIFWTSDVEAFFTLQVIILSLVVWTALAFGRNIRKHPLSWILGFILFAGLAVEVLAFIASSCSRAAH